MKQLIILVSFFFSTATAFSQESSGIATYTVPTGWQSSQKGSTVTLSNSRSKGGAVCRIIIYGTEQTVINSTELYLQSRGGKNSSNANYPVTKRITRKDANGFISFMTAGTATIDGKQVGVYFYSFTNNQQSFFIELQADSKACVDAFNQFLNNLLIEEAVEEGNVNNKAAVQRSKKAAPAAPAAPAPMM